MTEKEVQDTEQKIKEAARKIFHEKGFEATKTRDIAEQAGINLALLNYYFRSKKKLYEIIMMETVQSFFGSLQGILNDEQTSIREKLLLLVNSYIDILSENPDIPFFILHEVRSNPAQLQVRIPFSKAISRSVFARQFQEEARAGRIPAIHPLHLLWNLSSLLIFPFVSLPAVSQGTGLDEAELLALIKERKQLIPRWIEAILKVE
jgi:AcrR family transcriptional regulator